MPKNERTFCVLCDVEIYNKPSCVYKHVASKRHVENEKLKRTFEKGGGTFENSIPQSVPVESANTRTSDCVQIECKPNISSQSNWPVPGSTVTPSCSVDPEDLDYLFGLYVGAGLNKCSEVQASIARLKIQGILHQASLNQLSL